ncbi:hypothetical protein EBU94_01830 [bacterium]|nr:hypothetical protein [bacterium]
MICAYDECNKKFKPKTHNQKYCSDECCRIATNLKIKEKYYEKKERLNGKVRTCASEDCKVILSRYSDSKFCTTCLNKDVVEEKKKIAEMIKDVYR